MVPRTTRARSKLEEAATETAARVGHGLVSADPVPEIEVEEDQAAVMTASKRKRGLVKDEPAPAKKTTRAKTAPTRVTRKKKTQQVVTDEDDDIALAEDDNEDEEEVVPKPAKKQKATAAKTPTAKASTAKIARAPATKRKVRVKQVVEPVAEEIDDRGNAMDVDDPQAMVDATAPVWAVGMQDALTAQFETLDSKLTSANDKYSNDIEALGTRFDDMDVKFDDQTTAISADFDTKLEEQTDGFNARLDEQTVTFKGAIDHVNERVDNTNIKVTTLEQRMDSLENKVNDFKSAGSFQQAATDRLGKLEQGQTQLLTRYDDRFTRLDNSVAGVSAKLRGLGAPGQRPSGRNEDEAEGDRDSDSDSDSESGSESGNGDGVNMKIWNGIVGELQNGTTSHEPEESDDENSAEEQNEELHNAHMMAPDESTQGRQYPTTHLNINRVVTDEDEADYGDSTIFESPASERRGQQSHLHAAHMEMPDEFDPLGKRHGHGQQSAIAASKQGEANVVAPAKHKHQRVMRKMNRPVGPEDNTEDITFSGAPEFDPNLPSRQVGGQASTVAQLPPAAAASHYKAPKVRFEGEDTEFDEDEIDATSTPHQTPFSSRKLSSKVISKEHPTTPSSRKPGRSLQQKSVLRNAGKNERARLEKAGEEPTASKGDSKFSEVNASFDVSAASSPIVSRESPHSYIEDQRRFETEEGTEDVDNESFSGYGVELGPDASSELTELDSSYFRDNSDVRDDSDVRL